MSKSSGCRLAVMLLLAALLTVSFHIQPAKADEVIYIRPDGSVEPSDAPITSLDNITYGLADDLVNKSIVVERKGITLDGGGHLMQGTMEIDGIVLNTSGVTVRNMRISGFHFGVYWKSRQNETIVDNTFSNNRVSIHFESTYLGLSSYGNVITGNEISGNYEAGVQSYGPQSGADVINNTIRSSGWGIEFRNYCGAWGGNVADNLVEDGYCGISLTCVKCSLRNNTLVRSILNIGGMGVFHYDHDIDTSNTIDGKPIYYWKDQQNKTIPPDAAYIGLIRCRNITVEGLVLNGGGQGVVLAESSDCTVRNMNIVNMSEGIVIVEPSMRNRIYANNITECCRPILGTPFFEPNQNRIYNNNFIGNANPPRIQGPLGSWDLGYWYGGNFWSEYGGSDLFRGPFQNITGSDGIGDTPYSFSDVWGESNITDTYPLMEPWTSSWEHAPPVIKADTNYDGVVDIFDVVQVTSIYEYKEGDPEWNPLADLSNPWGEIDIFDVVACTSHYEETYH